MRQKNIAVAIILSFITCGIYALIWMAQITDDINTLAEDANATSGGKVVLFSFLTCGIYCWYWYFKMGEKVDAIKGESGSSNILYLVLGLLGLGIVSMCMMQDVVNKHAEA